MARITNAMLESRVARLNKEMGFPTEYLTDGRHNVGHFHLYRAYGKTGLHQLANDAGATRTIIDLTTKGDLFDLIGALLMGADLARSK